VPAGKPVFETLVDCRDKSATPKEEKVITESFLDCSCCWSTPLAQCKLCLLFYLLGRIPPVKLPGIC